MSTHRRPTTQPGTHACAVPGCGVHIGRDLLMCYHHWRKVPQHFKTAVLETWRAYRAESSLENYHVYRAARWAAVDHVRPAGEVR